MIPKISVLMSVYNGEKFLSEAIESILTQTFTDFEFLIINDASTDNTNEILKEFEKKDRRIRLLTNEKNIGLTKSLNRGLQIARSEYIARMDADDVSLPNRFAKQVELLDANPNIGVLGSAVQFIDENGDKGRIWQPPQEHGFLKWLLCFFYNPIAHPSVMMRSSLTHNVKGYNETMTTSQDYELWGRLSHLTRLRNFPEVMLLLRKHGEAVSYIQLQKQQENSFLISHQHISKLLAKTIPIENIRSLWNMIYGKDQLTSNCINQSGKLIYRLYQSVMSESSLSETEKSLIINDVIDKLIGLFKKSKYNIICQWRLCLYIVKLSLLRDVKYADFDGEVIIE